MKTKLFIRIIIIISISYLANQTLAASTSANYKITAEILDAGSAAGSSASYKLLGKVREHQLKTPSSTSYIIGEGFLKSAYFTAVTPALAPIIAGITPNSGVNSGPIDITNLAGTNFAAGASVKLSKSGQADIAATNVVVVNPGKITCAFDLTNASGGLWDVTVTNPDGRSGTLPSAFTITYAAPVITSIAPNAGLNNAIVNITNLTGKYFKSGAAVKLSKPGENDIQGENVVVESPTKITCQFNLVGKAVGLWDVSVINPDAQSATLRQGFKIEAPIVEIIGPVRNTPNPFDPGVGPTTIKYVLSKDVDVTLYLYSIRGERVWQWLAPAGAPGGQAGLNEVVWNGITAFKAIASSGVYILHVTANINGEIKILGKTKIAIIK